MFIKIIFSVKLAGCSLHSDAGGWQISLCFSCDMYASFTGVASNIYIIIIIIIKGTFFSNIFVGGGDLACSQHEVCQRMAALHFDPFTECRYSAEKRSY